jgi:hypothetical protein
MSNKRDDLRATAEDLIVDAERLKHVEERKLELDADDPQVERLADEGEQIAEEMLPKARLQRQIAEEPEAGGAGAAHDG